MVHEAGTHENQPILGGLRRQQPAAPKGKAGSDAAATPNGASPARGAQGGSVTPNGASPAREAQGGDRDAGDARAAEGGDHPGGHAQATERDADANTAHAASDVEDDDAGNEAPRAGGGGEANQARDRDGPWNEPPRRADSEAAADQATDDPDADGTPDVPEDQKEIMQDSAHIPDRDQEFQMRDAGDVGKQSGLFPDQFVGGADEAGMRGMQDMDEGEWGRISDPAYEREGSSRVQRAAMGDKSVEEHMTPAAREGEGGEDDPRGIETFTRDELYDRAKALNVPGRSKMSKDQLSLAVRDAMAH